MIEEIPTITSFKYMDEADEAVFYTVLFRKDRGDKYRIIFYKNNNIIANETISWVIPPDYIAARELLELAIKRQ